MTNQNFGSSPLAALEKWSSMIECNCSQWNNYNFLIFPTNFHSLRQYELFGSQNTYSVVSTNHYLHSVSYLSCSILLLLFQWEDSQQLNAGQSQSHHRWILDCKLLLVQGMKVCTKLLAVKNENEVLRVNVSSRTTRTDSVWVKWLMKEVTKLHWKKQSESTIRSFKKAYAVAIRANPALSTVQRAALKKKKRETCEIREIRCRDYFLSNTFLILASI